ncbi:hypothetical protein IM660_04400 [Ruania alkalisoli]|uniref:Uncharacterized protein n=1 Tax=Ruania alkalisoli TaxID=2779775 RepID=A0A7M1SVH4_9MICO|nr:hypothetical protein [Ruania alkalisoli]QOR71538.1 hypothetical protein IM660_04400 [Ruania alkalisoli]
MEFAGWVALAIAVMIFGYLLPTAIRSRQVVVDSRVTDRFSGGLRVLARTGEAPPTPTPMSTSRGFLHRTAAEEDRPMHSPVAARPAAADVRRAAAARAARAAAASRRAAAAKRRLVLTLALLALTAAGWTVVGLTPVNVVAGIVPTVAFGGVLVLGRRAAAQAKIADARWAAEIERARKAEQTRAARRPKQPEAKPSSLRIELDPGALMAEHAPEAEERRVDIPAGEGWTPVPVPAPMYTMKPVARRREPVVEDFSQPGAGAEAPTAEGSVPAESAGAEVGSGGGSTAGGAGRAVPAPSVDLQAVLERRRAVGQ